MTKKQLLGLFLLLIPFATFAVFMVVFAGWKTTVAVWLTAIAATVNVTAGILLLFPPQK